MVSLNAFWGERLKGGDFPSAVCNAATNSDICGPSPGVVIRQVMTLIVCCWLMRFPNQWLGAACVCRGDGVMSHGLITCVPVM